MPTGAVLRWVYNEDGDDTYSLLVRLTEQEAQEVFDSDSKTGMLESVRKELHWSGALIIVSDDRGPPYRSWRYIVQPDSSEEEFIRDLTTPPPHIVFEATLSAEQRRRLKRSAEQRRDLEFAEPILAHALAS
jgi:hypothetical protein